MTKSKKKPCSNCGSDMNPDEKLAELKERTMLKLAELFELKSNKGCLEAVTKLVELNAKLVLMVTELEFYVDLLMKLDKETLNETEQKPSYVS